MTGIVVWVLGMIATVVFSVVLHVTPALFHICIFVERLIFAGVQRLTNRSSAIGELTLISGVVWGLIGVVLGLIVLGGIVGPGTGALALGSIGLLWGLSVGYQAAVQELAHQLRQPGALYYHRPGSLEPPVTGVAQETDRLDGIILGEAREQRRH